MKHKRPDRLETIDNLRAAFLYVIEGWSYADSPEGRKNPISMDVELMDEETRIADNLDSIKMTSIEREELKGLAHDFIMVADDRMVIEKVKEFFKIPGKELRDIPF